MRKLLRRRRIRCNVSGFCSKRHSLSLQRQSGRSSRMSPVTSATSTTARPRRTSISIHRLGCRRCRGFIRLASGRSGSSASASLPSRRSPASPSLSRPTSRPRTLKGRGSPPACGIATEASAHVRQMRPHRPRGEVFISGARPGLISAGLRGATGLGVGRIAIAPFSLLIRGTQPGEGRRASTTSVR
jgi:hypothetical protein